MLEVIYTDSSYGAKLVAQTRFAQGDLVWKIADYEVVMHPTRQTIQVDRDTHISELGHIAYLNHSCRPNVIVDTTRLACYAARDIAPGDELTYFYPSTEWDLAQPFVCLCGAPECIRLVVGAKYLPLDVLGRYFINQHIRESALACLEAAPLPD